MVGLLATIVQTVVKELEDTNTQKNKNKNGLRKEKGNLLGLWAKNFHLNTKQTFQKLKKVLSHLTKVKKQNLLHLKKCL